jgi:hypothetical protein
MRKLLISFGGALFAASTVGGVALAKSPNAVSGGQGGQGQGQGQGFSRGPDLDRVRGRNTTPGVPRGRGPALDGPAAKGLQNAFDHNSDQAKLHGLPFRLMADAQGD